MPNQSFSYWCMTNFTDAITKLTPRFIHARIEAPIRRFIAQRVGDYYAPSNRRLAKLINVDLAALGYPP